MYSNTTPLLAPGISSILVATHWITANYWWWMVTQPLLVAITWAACTPHPGEIHTYAFRVLLRPILPNHSSTSGINTPLIMITSRGTTLAASIRSLTYGEIVL